jgi:predicted esterase
MSKLHLPFTALLFATLPLLSAPIYTEDFVAPRKLGNSGATAELGNGGSYAMETWVYSNGNAGVNDPPVGNGSGDNADNEIATTGLARAQSGRGTNARALAIILNGNRFAGGVEYTLSFDVIGDAQGGDAGRFWLALVSGTDSSNGVLIDGTHNGWGAGAGSPKPFTTSGNGETTITYLADSPNNGVAIDGENSAGTRTVSFSFTHDGVSDVAFAVGTYNNIFAIDNVVINDPNEGNILPSLVINEGIGKYEEITTGSVRDLRVSASDSDGTISRIRVLVDAQLVGEVTGQGDAQFSDILAGLTPGPRQLEVVAIDNLGGVAAEEVPFYLVPVDGELTGQHVYTNGASNIREYLRFVPEAYNEDPQRQWPLLIWLHGAGNRGSDASILPGAGGPPSRIKNNDPLLDAFIVLSPQVRSGQNWQSTTSQEQLDALVDAHVTRFRIDPERLIITGQSMGGAGTYSSIIRHPHKYAAAAPICGFGDTSAAASIAHLPIWLFHGDQDSTVPYIRSVEMNTALLNAGAQNTKFHTIINGGHNVWTETYQRADLYEWMLLMSWLPRFYPDAPAWEPLIEQDSDGDGRSALEEHDSGTSPIDPNSVFKLLPTTIDADGLELQWTSVPGKSYTVYSSSSLNNDWQPLQADPIPADPSAVTRYRYTGGTSGFFRVVTRR